LSQNYEGVVRSTLERPWKGKKLYSFFLDGVEGLFKMGEKRPTFKEGSYVKFTADDKLQVMGEVEAQNRAPVEAKAATTQQVQKVEKATSAYEDKDAKRQKSIHYQSARNAAIEVIRLALEHGAISLGTKKGQMLDNLLGYVNEVTNRYFVDNENGGHVETTGDESSPTASESPSDDGDE
jgi:hypothetical protein